MTSGGNNLDSNGSCAFAAPGDQNNVDPQLGPLAAVPPPTSAGTRPKDGDGTPVCDIGAVEAAVHLCPNDPAKREPGGCGCGVADTDAAMANRTAGVTSAIEEREALAQLVRVEPEVLGGVAVLAVGVAGMRLRVGGHERGRVARAQARGRSIYGVSHRQFGRQTLGQWTVSGPGGSHCSTAARPVAHEGSSHTTPSPHTATLQL